MAQPAGNFFVALSNMDWLATFQKEHRASPSVLAGHLGLSDSLPATCAGSAAR
ncbi:MAG: hypothetical protein R2854_00640 [Caldilineaceae bacterium]